LVPWIITFLWSKSKKNELNQILKDNYPPFEARNVLGFLIHDLQHLEKFMDPKFHCEQVGILHYFKKMIDNVELMDIFFKDYDQEFRNDVDHCISDMNACCLHLLAFFKAKWKMAKQRFLKEKPILYDEPFEKMYDDLLSRLDIPPHIREAAGKLCSDQFFPEQGGILRNWFHEEGKRLLGLDFELLQ